MDHNTTAIILALIGVIVLGTAITITVKLFIRNRNRTDSNRVVQKNIATKGDIAGRDINKGK